MNQLPRALLPSFLLACCLTGQQPLDLGFEARTTASASGPRFRSSPRLPGSPPANVVVRR
jgi:hypothetical protein